MSYVERENITNNERFSVREGTLRRAFIPLYPELLDRYLPVAGPSGILLWLLLKRVALLPGDSQAISLNTLAQSIGLGDEGVKEAMNRLVDCGLVSRQLAEEDASGGEIVVVHDPPSAGAPLPHEIAEREAAAQVEEESFRSDLEALVDIYHQKIGLMGPMQFEKLRFWVEERGMAAEVVAAAIDETARNADRPRMQYLEGILRNWYNDGIRSYADLVAKADWVAQMAEKEGQSKTIRTQQGYEGVANAQAYRPVESELIRRWKELYPDECDE